MKEVRKDELPEVQGGAQLVGIVIDTLPQPVATTTPGAIEDGALQPPTLPQKHVET